MAEKNRLISHYKDASGYTEDLQALRDSIQAHRDNALPNLDELLLDDFKRLGVKYEEAFWDKDKEADGKTKKRTIQIQDVTVLHPFHWGYEFDKVMERGGFDIIIANPPWEILKPQAKEFFSTHSKLVSKNKMRIEDFETERTGLLKDPEIRAAWLKYQNGFPYQSAYFRTVEQYKNQVSIVDGKKSGTDINLYKLFTEQCYNLLCEGGQCGIVLPSGIYTDLGAKQLRELLFDQTQVTGLFCFENRKAIFENVDSRFKFVVLTFEKGGQTQMFPSAFMRQDADELERFPRYGSLDMSVELIRRLSPDSLSIMEFKNEDDVDITENLLKAPLLRERTKAGWVFKLTNEFHMTNDSHLFSTEPGPSRSALYEGKMIHQFTHLFGKPRYWIDQNEGRKDLLQQEMRRVEIALDAVAKLDANVSGLATRQARVSAFLEVLHLPPLSHEDVYIDPEAPRLAFRDIARNTDARTLIATILPPGVFAGNTLNYVMPWYFDAEELFDRPESVKACYRPTFLPRTLAYLCGVFNSFTLDYLLRFKVTTHANMFYIYQMPVPRLAPDEPRCVSIATRVARLVCIGPEFDSLRLELLGDIDAPVATDPDERKQIKSEIDGLVATSLRS